jgi:serine protease
MKQQLFIYRRHLAARHASSFLVGRALVLCIVASFALTLGQPVLVHAAPSRLTKQYSDTVLHLKLKDTAHAELQGTAFAGSDASAINKVLAKYRPVTKRQLFAADKATLRAQAMSLRAQGHAVADLSQYYEVKLPKGSDTKAVAAALKKLSTVSEAYPAPLPAPTPASPSFVSSQLYRNAAPVGVNAGFAATWPGAKGDGVKVVDLEYAWNANHEDIAKARAAGARISVNTPADPLNDSMHGTAVLGVIAGTSNAYGVTGLAPNASLGMANTISQENGWDIAGAIYTAVSYMKAGDIMLIENQMWGPTAEEYDFVPVEWIPEIYDAITYATAQNIVVVETAGNGNQNLDNTSVYGSSFPMGKPDSGAIIVGSSTSCASGAAARSRRTDTTYGKRVNLQGWGECVATASYGDAYNGGPNALYTKQFAGTSSAGAIVASAAASFVAAYKKLNDTPPTPAAVRSTLQSTGTPQNFTGALTGNIGPLPNLAKALLATDKSKPTGPKSLVGKLNTSKKPILSWTAATDNVGVVSYQIYCNDVLYKTIAPATSYTDTAALARKTYTYKVRALDAAGRASVFSNTTTVKTP